MKTITIKLTAPLQSFGNEASFNRRTSWPYPSKSSVIGMVAAALGYDRDDKRIEALNQLKFAVRVDQLGSTMTDFQIVEYDQSKGTKKLSYRDYVQDAVYLVALGSEDSELIDNINFALLHPAYALFLGRRSDPPAGVLRIKAYDNLDPLTVLKDSPWQAANWYIKKQTSDTYRARIIADASLLPGVKPEFMKDAAISFDQRNRQHGYRAIAKTVVSLPVPQNSSNHDIMSAL
ncbi:type I-E CRISPR-associated protein Cas5/CasD [Lactobacillus corticis]|uniref:CRISPR-associated protein n=1 Tax=Lactobacillus corticis TaxID=2201249 RepID=A0A916VH18_9LACO|nr:type I-E CRISPR-associated protein Cas5/CasD [Lactobacillus corticis]GFZ26132.1 CRISPR-associated protein [Lactobacillus corticis]